MSLTPLSSASECAKYIHDNYNAGNCITARIATLVIPYFELKSAVSDTSEVIFKGSLSLLNLSFSLFAEASYPPVSDDFKELADLFPSFGRTVYLICEIAVNILFTFSGVLLANIDPSILYNVHTYLDEIKTSFYKNEEDASVVSKTSELLRGNLDDVIGLDDIKESFKLIVEQYMPENQELVKKLGVCLPNGILLHGSPGCGKTFIIEKFVAEIQGRIGKPVFFKRYVAEDGSAYLHQTAQGVAKLFKDAAEAALQNNAPSIIFIDEIDTILPKRDGLGNQAQDSARKEDLGTFLRLLNNAGQKNILVVAATNDFESLDEALVRPGRMDRVFHIRTPSKQTLMNQFEAQFKKLTQNIAKAQNLSFNKLCVALNEKNATMSAVPALVSIIADKMFALQLKNREQTIILTQSILDNIQF